MPIPKPPELPPAVAGRLVHLHNVHNVPAGTLVALWKGLKQEEDEKRRLERERTHGQQQQLLHGKAAEPISWETAGGGDGRVANMAPSENAPSARMKKKKKGGGAKVDQREAGDDDELEDFLLPDYVENPYEAIFTEVGKKNEELRRSVQTRAMHQLMAHSSSGAHRKMSWRRRSTFSRKSIFGALPPPQHRSSSVASTTGALVGGSSSARPSLGGQQQRGGGGLLLLEGKKESSSSAASLHHHGHGRRGKFTVDHEWKGLLIMRQREDREGENGDDEEGEDRRPPLLRQELVVHPPPPAPVPRGGRTTDEVNGKATTLRGQREQGGGGLQGVPKLPHCIASLVGKARKREEQEHLAMMQHHADHENLDGEGANEEDPILFAFPVLNSSQSVKLSTLPPPLGRDAVGGLNGTAAPASPSTRGGWPTPPPIPPSMSSCAASHLRAATARSIQQQRHISSSNRTTEGSEAAVGDGGWIETPGRIVAAHASSSSSARSNTNTKAGGAVVPFRPTASTVSVGGSCRGYLLPGTLESERAKPKTFDFGGL